MLLHQLSFDALEDGSIHRRVDDPRRDETVASQPGDEGLRLPFAEWRMRPVALALRRPAGAFGQLGVGRRPSIKISRAKALLKSRFRSPIHSSRAGARRPAAARWPVESWSRRRARPRAFAG